MDFCNDQNKSYHHNPKLCLGGLFPFELFYHIPALAHFLSLNMFLIQVSKSGLASRTFIPVLSNHVEGMESNIASLIKLESTVMHCTEPSLTVYSVAVLIHI